MNTDCKCKGKCDREKAVNIIIGLAAGGILGFLLAVLLFLSH